MNLWEEYILCNKTINKINITNRLISRFFLRYERFDVYEILRLIDGGWLE
jgi:hypothetical protein